MMDKQEGDSQPVESENLSPKLVVVNDSNTIDFDSKGK